MSRREIDAADGRRITVAELGSGPPLLYLHDFLDIHGASLEWTEFHQRLAAQHRLIAPAHAGCAGSAEDEDATGIEDVVVHLLDALDALGLGPLPILGVGVGGWVAAEFAIRHRSAVERLALVGATGLFLPGEPIADPFFAAQPVDGQDMSDLRRIFFASAASAVAKEWVPDGRMSVEREMLRYQMFRFAARFGFNPPYLYHRRLGDRLRRYDRPALVLWGEADGLVPLAHGRAYAAGLPQARLRLFPGAGHSLHLEQPQAAATEILSFLDG